MNSHLRFAAFTLTFAITSCGIAQDSDVKEATRFVVPQEQATGGDAVVCFKTKVVQNSVNQRLRKNRYDPEGAINPFNGQHVLNDISSVQVLDVYEYSLPVGFPPAVRKLMAVDKDYMKTYNKILERIKARSPFGEKLEATMAQLPLKNWTAAPGIPTLSSNDAATFIPEECLLITVALRRDNVVYYDASLHGKLDPTNALALVLHELVYKIASDLGSTDARITRQTVGLLMSQDELPNMSDVELEAALMRL